MVRPMLLCGVVVAGAALLAAGAARSDPAAGPERAGDHRSSEIAPALEATAPGTVGGGSPVSRVWTPRRDQQAPTGDELMDAMLAAMILALVAATARPAAPGTGRPSRWTSRATGARSPPPGLA